MSLGFSGRTNPWNAITRAASTRKADARYLDIALERPSCASPGHNAYYVSHHGFRDAPGGIAPLVATSRSPLAGLHARSGGVNRNDSSTPSYYLTCLRHGRDQQDRVEAQARMCTAPHAFETLCEHALALPSRFRDLFPEIPHQPLFLFFAERFPGMRRKLDADRPYEGTSRRNASRHTEASFRSQRLPGAKGKPCSRLTLSPLFSLPPP